jgi:hypothetical protein
MMGAETVQTSAMPSVKTQALAQLNARASTTKLFH